MHPLLYEMNMYPNTTPNTLDLLECVENNTIASCKPAMPPGMINYLNQPVNNNQEGKIPMCTKALNSTSVLAVSAPVSIEGTQRDFYTQRIYSENSKRDVELRKQFNMDVRNNPETAKDLIKAITDGDCN